MLYMLSCPTARFNLFGPAWEIVLDVMIRRYKNRGCYEHWDSSTILHFVLFAISVCRLWKSVVRDNTTQLRLVTSFIFQSIYSHFVPYMDTLKLQFKL